MNKVHYADECDYCLEGCCEDCPVRVGDKEPEE